MLKHMYVGELRIPSYAMMVALGIAICSLAILIVAKLKKVNYEPITVAGFLGAISSVFGAKALTMLQSIMTGNYITLTWDSFKDAAYSYYGGLAVFLIVMSVALNKRVENSREYLSGFIFLVPLLHVFWKIGCFLGGCCYGVHYDGPGAVVFPEGVNSLSGQQVFPVQLMEAAFALVISLILVLLDYLKKMYSPIGVFITLYGITRFFAEFLRYHEKKYVISDGQVYSMISIGLGVLMIWMSYRGFNNERTRTENI